MQSETISHSNKNSSAAKTLVKSANHLEKDLRKVIRGEVRFDAGSRALYSTDSSNYRQPPIGVVLPRDSEDVEKTVSLCRKRHSDYRSRRRNESRWSVLQFISDHRFLEVPASFD